jgi:hypothetical protein
VFQGPTQGMVPRSRSIGEVVMPKKLTKLDGTTTVTHIPKGFSKRIDKAFKGAVKMAKAQNQLFALIKQLKEDSAIKDFFIHHGVLDRPEFVILVNNWLSNTTSLDNIYKLAAKASYKVETTINEALVILSNLQKLPDNVKIFTSIQKPQRKDIK